MRFLSMLVAVAVPISAANVNVLYNFRGELTGVVCANSPLLVVPATGLLYGTSACSGTAGLGSLYSLNTSSNVVTTLYSFTTAAAGDITSPQALMLHSNGLLYGTYQGQPVNQRLNGGAFSYNALTNVLNVNSMFNSSIVNNIGGVTLPMLQDATSSLMYGTALFGGAYGSGALFSMSTVGAVTVLHSFADTSIAADGSSPRGVAQISSGLLIGATSSGGNSNTGTVYTYNPTSTEYKQIWLIPGNRYGINSATGSTPMSVLLVQNVVFVTCAYGGANGIGSIMTMNIDGSNIVNRLNFTSSTSGRSPQAAMVLGSDGLVYGTAYGDASVASPPWSIASGATVWAINPVNYQFSVIHIFNFTEGTLLASALTQAPTGLMYGSSSAGGAYTNGTIYSFAMNVSASSVSALTPINNATTAAMMTLQLSTGCAAYTANALNAAAVSSAVGTSLGASSQVVYVNASCVSSTYSTNAVVEHGYSARSFMALATTTSDAIAVQMNIIAGSQLPYSLYLNLTSQLHDASSSLRTNTLTASSQTLTATSTSTSTSSAVTVTAAAATLISLMSAVTVIALML